jgi:hypothetical protein
MYVEGFKVVVNTRSGKSLRDFVIWEEGYRNYSLSCKE